ncbi:MAG: sensor histidine kinase [bacterium]
MIEIKSKYNKLILGLFVTALSFITPKILWSSQFNILEDVYLSLESNDISVLIIAAIKVVFLNTIRHLPIFLGIFIIADDLYQTMKRKINSILETSKYSLLKKNLTFLLPFIFIPIIYELISNFYNMSFVFSNVSIVAIFVLLIVYKIIEDIKFISIKIIIVTLIVFAFDWVDIIPMFSRFDFGRGDLTLTVHQAAEFIEATKILNILGIIFSAILLLNIFFLAKVSKGYHNYLYLIEESKNKERKMNKVQMEALESRYYREIKNLVHDLKTPLTTIQGLGGLIKLGVDEKKAKEYAEKITNTTDKMNLIISEVLLEDKKSEIEIKELFSFVKSQILCDDFYKNVSFEIISNIKIKVNKYRMSRAIINLIDNALKASDSLNHKVLVKATANNGKSKIIIKDNGPGILPENIDRIWEPGFTSNPDDTGLGLNFVKNVVENHGGSISINSKVGIGTEVHINLEEVSQNEKCAGSR